MFLALLRSLTSTRNMYIEKANFEHAMGIKQTPIARGD